MIAERVLVNREATAHDCVLVIREASSSRAGRTQCE
jgi:hypothetical protein